MMVSIRLANAKDFDVLINFRIKLLEWDNKLDERIERTPESIKKSSKYMKQYLKTKSNFYLLAYDGIVPLGYLHTNFDDKKNKDSSYISELFVHSSYRGKGIGKKFLKKNEQLLKEKNIKISGLTTALRKNKATIEFYKRSGYKIVEKNSEDNYVVMRK